MFLSLLNVEAKLLLVCLLGLGQDSGALETRQPRTEVSPDSPILSARPELGLREGRTQLLLLSQPLTAWLLMGHTLVSSAPHEWNLLSVFDSSVKKYLLITYYIQGFGARTRNTWVFSTVRLGNTSFISEDHPFVFVVVVRTGKIYSHSNAEISHRLLLGQVHYIPRT